MTAVSHGKFFLDLRRKKGRFARFKQSLEVHWLSISLGYNLRKAYWPLVRCSRLFSLPSTCNDRLSNYLFILCNLQARARNEMIACQIFALAKYNRKTQTINARKVFPIYGTQYAVCSVHVMHLNVCNIKFIIITTTSSCARSARFATCARSS